MKINRRYVAIVIAAIAALLIIITRQPKEYRTASGVVWHTTYNITYESDKNQCCARFSTKLSFKV